MTRQQNSTQKKNVKAILHKAIVSNDTRGVSGLDCSGYRMISMYGGSIMRKAQLLRMARRMTVSNNFDSPSATKNLRTGCCGSRKKRIRPGSVISVEM